VNQQIMVSLLEVANSERRKKSTWKRKYVRRTTMKKKIVGIKKSHDVIIAKGLDMSKGLLL